MESMEMPEEDEDFPKDWEPDEDEIPPGRLQDKWFREELSFKETVTCPGCRKELPRETVRCFFCDTQVFQESGLLGHILKWFKQIFRG
jgi:hypothetical protein